MRQSVTNSLLPFYADPRERVRADHDGFGIDASGRFLMPFYVPGGNTSSFRLVSEDGQIVDIPTSLIQTVTDADGDTFEVFDGSDIGSSYCGLHSIILTTSDGVFYSAWMNLRQGCVNQFAAAAIVSAIPNATMFDYTLSFPDNVEDVVASSNTLIDGGVRTVFTGTTISPQSSSFSIERVVKGACGTFRSTYTVVPGLNPSLLLIDRSSRPNDDDSDLWRFDFSDDGAFDDAPYQSGFTHSLYLNLNFSEPTASTDDDYWTNGIGERFLNYANTQDRVNAVATDVPDDIIGRFKAVSKAATITATRLLTGRVYDVSDMQIQFSPQADQVSSSASISWVREYYHADAFNDRRVVS